MHDPQDIRPSEQIRSLRSTFMDRIAQRGKKILIVQLDKKETAQNIIHSNQNVTSDCLFI